MSVWAIADLHLSFGVRDKEMDIFGVKWKKHHEKLRASWLESVRSEDLVLIAGDISWALKSEAAKADLDWIGALPGTKVLLKGNHDYWWDSLTKVKEILPPSCVAIHNNAFTWRDVTIGGSRLWDTDEFDFYDFIEGGENIPQEGKKGLEDQRIFQREIQRLEMSLKQMDPKARWRIAMTHYPPIGADLKESTVSRLFEKYGIDIAVFGHLHNLKPDISLFGEKNGVRYYLTACDYLDFKPLKIL